MDVGDDSVGVSNPSAALYPGLRRWNKFTASGELLQTTSSNLCTVNREVIVLELISADGRIIYELGVTVRFIIITNLYYFSIVFFLSYDFRK